MQKFSEVAEAISQTTKKLEKEKILSEYLRSLSPEDLKIACIFLSGSPYALRDQRTTNVGFAAVRDSLMELDPEADGKLGPILLRTGDLGTAVEELFRQRQVIPQFTLQQVRSAFEALSAAATNQEKRKIMTDLLKKATPLESKYILKILLGGMRIGLQESLVESSIAKAFHKPLKQIQHVNMLLGDIGETALLALEDRLSEAKMTLLYPLKLMLASPEEDPARILNYMSGSGLAEDKYDGIRAQIHKDRSGIKIYSRDLDDITGSFPDISNAVLPISSTFLMDGEIVPFRHGKIMSFGELQKRLGRKVLTREMLETIPCHYFAFDLLFLDGELLLEQPLIKRREKLLKIYHSFPAFTPATQVAVKTVEEIETAFELSRGRNNEGLVVKHAQSVYAPGKRGKSWLKLKRAMLTLDVVVTIAEYGHGKRRGLLSDYTFAVRDHEKLLTIGKAYSGITDQELNQLSELFHKISVKDEGYYHVVPPQVVLEVTFDRINRSSRHSSGFALRFPRIKRIRWDKTPEEIDTLETVEKLYNTHFK